MEADGSNSLGDITVQQTSEDPEEMSTKPSNQGLNKSHSTTKLEEKPTLSDTCEETSPSKAILNTYEGIHRSKHVFSCPECEKEFPTEDRMMSHMKLHLKGKEESNSCEHSSSIDHGDEEQASAKSRGKRRKTKAENGNLTREFHCDMCSKSFSTKGNLKTHLLLHSNEKPFSCPECYKHFRTKGILKTHLYVHTTKETPFSCNICEKTFTTHGISQTHEQTVHLNKIKYACNTCGKEFATLGNYQTHERSVHAKEKTYECQICNHAFSTKGNLQTHCKRHSEERDCVCRKCGKRFVTKPSLKLHRESHVGTRARNSRVRARSEHAEEQTYECLFCNHAFSTKGNLQAHCKRHSEERDCVCRRCGKRFVTNSSLKMHRKSHVRARVKTRKQSETKPTKTETKGKPGKRTVPKESKVQKSKVTEPKTKSKNHQVKNNLRNAFLRSRMRGQYKLTALQHNETNETDSRSICLETIAGYSVVVHLSSKRVDNVKETRKTVSPDVSDTGANGLEGIISHAPVTSDTGDNGLEGIITHAHVSDTGVNGLEGIISHAPVSDAGVNELECIINHAILSIEHDHDDN